MRVNLVRVRVHLLLIPTQFHFLNASGGWDTFYYKSSATTNVTKMHTLGTRRPGGGSSAAALE